MGSKQSILTPNYGAAMELFSHLDHLQRCHFSILGMKTGFELKDGGVRFKITRCLKQNYKLNYWGILWSYLTQEDQNFFLVLRKFWTWIKPHIWNESGATCAARLLRRTDVSAASRMAWRQPKGRHLQLHLQPQICWKESSPVNNKKQRF